MHHPTRHAVEIMLPPGTTLDDLSEQEVQDLFDSIVRQAEAEAEVRAGPDPQAADPDRAA